ncbi:hypothetical protein DPQ22_03430 [Candidatus Tokpelaia sp.]|nr:hypothetical protein DPQ22_03430 [Candidatus Tokpelaia sp.]
MNRLPAGGEAGLKGLSARYSRAKGFRGFAARFQDSGLAIKGHLCTADKLVKTVRSAYKGGSQGSQMRALKL